MKKERNWGVDLLRILSMLMILFLHVLGRGGILTHATKLSTQYEVAWLLETASYCAVNCYALISGYVGVRSRFRFSNLLQLWLQVVTYSFGITVITGWISPDKVATKDYIHALFPVSHQYYWYFTAYFCLFFFLPVLNHLLNTLSQRKLLLLMLSLVFLFSILPSIFNRDIFYTKNGYSACWLIVLYLIGGYCRRFDPLKNWSGLFSLAIYALCVLASWEIKWALESVEHAYADVLVRYTSPTILLAAVALLNGCSKLRVSRIPAAVIRFLAPLAFGVYLIHVHPLPWKYVMNKAFVAFAEYSPLKLVGAVIVAVLALYLLCTVIEYIRHLVFRLLRIPVLCDKLEQWMRSVYSRLCARLHIE